MILLLASNLKVGKPMLCCFFFQTQHRFLHKNNLLLFMFANFLKSFVVVFFGGGD